MSLNVAKILETAKGLISTIIISPTKLGYLIILEVSSKLCIHAHPARDNCRLLTFGEVYFTKTSGKVPNTNWVIFAEENGGDMEWNESKIGQGME